MKTLIINIKQLVQVEKAPRTWVAGDDMSRLESISNAWLYTENGKIAAFGKMEDLDRAALHLDDGTVEEIDATGRLVLPSFCDSHTHLVYAGSREIEYIDKIRGLSYEEIARRGGASATTTAKRLPAGKPARRRKLPTAERNNKPRRRQTPRHTRLSGCRLHIGNCPPHTTSAAAIACAATISLRRFSGIIRRGLPALSVPAFFYLTQDNLRGFAARGYRADTQQAA